MRIQIASDLHLEFLERDFPDFRRVQPTDADVLVLAGDIHSGGRGVEMFRDWPWPVIYVGGNHEVYGKELERTLGETREVAAKTPNVHLLENDELILDGVRFLGSTLWTDFALYPYQVEKAKVEARVFMQDFSVIRTRQGRFTPEASMALHAQAKAWLARKLREPFDGKTVVVTHHLPSMRSVAERFKGDLVSAAFASQLDDLVALSDLWIHGHTHDSFDYRIGPARVICNPGGYPRTRSNAAPMLRFENESFDDSLVVEI